MPNSPGENLEPSQAASGAQSSTPVLLPLGALFTQYIRVLPEYGVLLYVKHQRYFTKSNLSRYLQCDHHVRAPQRSSIVQ